MRVVVGDVFWPGRCCFNWEKFESLDAHATSPRFIYNCGKYGASLLFPKVSIMLQEHVKTTKTIEINFFSPEKMSRDYEVEEPSPLLQNNLHQSQSTTRTWIEKIQKSTL